MIDRIAIDKLFENRQMFPIHCGENGSSYKAVIQTVAGLISCKTTAKRGSDGYFEEGLGRPAIGEFSYVTWALWHLVVAT